MIINKTVEKIGEWLCLGSSKQCYLTMYTVVRTFQVKKILEIGTHQGSSSITMCQAILDNGYKPEIWTVDSWEGFEGNEASKNLKEKAAKHFREAGFEKYISMQEGDSKVVVPKLLKEIGKVDLCMIDGDHSNEGVKADYDNCKDHTNLILFHDSGDGGHQREMVEKDGWRFITFPTRFLEGDKHLIGVSLAFK